MRNIWSAVGDVVWYNCVCRETDHSPSVSSWVSVSSPRYNNDSSVHRPSRLKWMKWLMEWARATDSEDDSNYISGPLKVQCSLSVLSFNYLLVDQVSMKEITLKVSFCYCQQIPWKDPNQHEDDLTSEYPAIYLIPVYITDIHCCPKLLKHINQPRSISALCFLLLISLTYAGLLL